MPTEDEAERQASPQTQPPKSFWHTPRSLPLTLPFAGASVLLLFFGGAAVGVAAFIGELGADDKDLWNLLGGLPFALFMGYVGAIFCGVLWRAAFGKDAKRRQEAISFTGVLAVMGSAIIVIGFIAGVAIGALTQGIRQAGLSGAHVAYVVGAVVGIMALLSVLGARFRG